MKNKIEVETYKFVGDGQNNIAHQIEKGRVLGTYRQTDVIKALNENRQWVVNGKKINSSINSKNQAYLIYYGDEDHKKTSLIKILVDKKALKEGDSNALAVEGLCEGAINIHANRRKLAVISSVIVGSLIMGSVVGFVKLANDEAMRIAEENQQYVQMLDEAREEYGVSSVMTNDFEHSRGGK